MGQGTLTFTAQLSCPAAYTLASALHTSVSFVPLERAEELELYPALEYADWHALAVLQTLHPVPDHPSSQLQPVMLGSKPESQSANARPEPWKMLPPHAG